MDDTLAQATAYALEIREKAEERAKEISGQAYEALRQRQFFARGYGQGDGEHHQRLWGHGLVPASHLIDGAGRRSMPLHKAGDRLKIAGADQDHGEELVRPPRVTTRKAGNATMRSILCSRLRW